MKDTLYYKFLCFSHLSNVLTLRHSFILYLLVVGHLINKEKRKGNKILKLKSVGQYLATIFFLTKK